MKKWHCVSYKFKNKTLNLNVRNFVNWPDGYNFSTHFVCFFFLLNSNWFIEKQNQMNHNVAMMVACALCTIVKRIVIIVECFKF